MMQISVKKILLVIAAFVIGNNILFYPNNILSWDVFGYYSYLPLKFIYHSLHLNDLHLIEKIAKEYNSTATLYQFVQLPEGNQIIKYSMGLSYFYAPFFFIGHLFALLFHFKTDGYSAPYQCAILIGGIVYTILGLIFLTKVLKYFFEEKIVIIVLLLTVFATNFVFHVTMYGQNAMSHSLLFFTYAAILWFTIQWHQSQKFKYIIPLAIFLGLTIIARPSEIVCLFIPLFWNVFDRTSFMDKWQLILKEWKQIFILFIIIAFIQLPQLIYWKTQTGHFLYDSYGNNYGEGFEFFHPYILEVLFSFRKGWLLYTPIMIVAIAGLYRLNKDEPKLFYALFIYFVLNLYIVSSWSCWWYAQSFSQRSLISSYPVMALSMGYFMKWIFSQRIIYRYIFLFFGACFLALNLFQTVQFDKGIIDGDRMTAAYFGKTFLKMNVKDEYKSLLLVNRSFSGNNAFTDEFHYHKRDLEILTFEKFHYKDTTIAFEGRASFKMDSALLYSPEINAKYIQITDQDHAWIRASAMVFIPKDVSNPKFSIIFKFENKNRPYGSIGFDAENMQLKPGEWNLIKADYLTPEVRTKDDVMKVFFFQRGKAQINIDNFKVEVFERNLEQPI
jgi:hypothetical protein